MQTEIFGIIPVLPSVEISRDIVRYEKNAGFETRYSDKMYSVLCRDNICLHSQWHADTENDRFDVCYNDFIPSEFCKMQIEDLLTLRSRRLRQAGGKSIY